MVAVKDLGRFHAVRVRADSRWSEPRCVFHEADRLETASRRLCVVAAQRRDLMVESEALGENPGLPAFQLDEGRVAASWPPSRSRQ